MKRMQKKYKVIDLPPLTAEERGILEEMSKRPASEIDCEDIPDIKPDAAVGFYYKQPVKLRQKEEPPKLDDDNITWLSQSGSGYLASLNKVLRWARQNHCPIATL